MRGIYSYIAEELLVPDTAAGQVQRIMKEIRSLEEMPMRYRLYDDEPWHGLGLRFFPVDNYLVFYLPDDNTNAVRIVRIMYGGRGHPQTVGRNNRILIFKKHLSQGRCFYYAHFWKGAWF